MSDHHHVGNSKTSNIADKRSPHSSKEHKSHKKVKSKQDNI